MLTTLIAAVDPVAPRTFIAPTDQIWAIVAGGLAPLVAYILNYLGPWVDEKIKGIVQLIAAAIAGGLAQAITAGNIGFNNTTLQFVVTAILASMVGHAGYKWSTISTALGGGRNRGDAA